MFHCPSVNACITINVFQARKHIEELEQDLHRERDESLSAKVNVDALTERVDSLKDQLLETERALVQKDEELYTSAGERDRTDAIQVTLQTIAHVSVPFQWQLLFAPTH